MSQRIVRYSVKSFAGRYVIGLRVLGFLLLMAAIPAGIWLDTSGPLAAWGFFFFGGVLAIMATSGIDVVDPEELKNEPATR